MRTFVDTDIVLYAYISKDFQHGRTIGRVRIENPFPR
jgi:predicted nucleic acid-binding protein